jgi:hypothetical protein
MVMNDKSEKRSIKNERLILEKSTIIIGFVDGDDAFVGFDVDEGRVGFGVLGLL